jgi:hypothetical protein
MKSLTAVGLFTAWRKQEPSELHRQEVQAADLLLPNSSIDGNGTLLPDVKQ